jgi:hypothetical protein
VGNISDPENIMRADTIAIVPSDQPFGPGRWPIKVRATAAWKQL